MQKPKLTPLLALMTIAALATVPFAHAADDAGKTEKKSSLMGALSKIGKTPKAEPEVAATPPPKAATKGAAEDARATAQQRIDAIVKGDFKTIYDGMPASYKKDASNVVKAFANKIDSDFYNASRDILIAFADVGVAKPEWSAALLEDHIEDCDKDMVVKFSNILKMLLVDLSYDTLKQGDVNAILSGKGMREIGKIFVELMGDELAPSKVVKAVANDDGTVTITTRDGDGDEEDEIYHKVEGVWIEGDIKESWAEGIKEALDAIKDLELEADIMKKVTEAAPNVKSALANAARARNEEQFQQRILIALTPILLIFDDEGDDDDDDE